MEKKIVMVTGATSGIGEACARKFARGGYNVIITGRRKEKLDTLRRELENMGAEVLAMEFDVRERASARKAVDFLKGKWANINVLINNAGLALGLDKEYEGSFEDWDTMIDTNIKGLLNMTRFVVPGMVERNEGHIINIGSVAGDAAYANGNVYCATKAAVRFLSDGIRIDTIDKNIKVSTLQPGIVETDFSEVRFHGDKERAKKVYEGVEALKPEDIADVALYVANQPKHVQISDVTIMATKQATGFNVHREK